MIIIKQFNFQLNLNTTKFNACTDALVTEQKDSHSNNTSICPTEKVHNFARTSNPILIRAFVACLRNEDLFQRSRFVELS